MLRLGEICETVRPFSLSDVKIKEYRERRYIIQSYKAGEVQSEIRPLTSDSIVFAASSLLCMKGSQAFRFDSFSLDSKRELLSIRTF